MRRRRADGFIFAAVMLTGLVPNAHSRVASRRCWSALGLCVFAAQCPTASTSVYASRTPSRAKAQDSRPEWSCFSQYRKRSEISAMVLTTRLLANREESVEEKKCAQAQDTNHGRRSIPANQPAPYQCARVIPAAACEQPLLEGRSGQTVRLKRTYCIQSH
jgi:hypothetical protein